MVFVVILAKFIISVLVLSVKFKIKFNKVIRPKSILFYRI